MILGMEITVDGIRYRVVILNLEEQYVVLRALSSRTKKVLQLTFTELELKNEK
jgi:hypothetical protein